MSRRCRGGVWLTALLAVAGCAPAMPSLSGGSATPARRVDLAVGGAARVVPGRRALPTGVGDDSSVPRSAGAGGVVPVIAVHHGAADRWEWGVSVAGTQARLGLRRERVRTNDTVRHAWVTGGGLIFGWTVDEGIDGIEGDGGARVGAEASVVYAVDYGGLYEIWAGPRLGAEHVGGRFARGADTPSANALVLRAGAVLGLGLGFRRLHALVELTAAYEGWLAGAHGDADLDGGGFVLIPAFALRLRI